MTNKTEMVSVPRELAQRLDELLCIMTGDNSAQKMVRKYGSAFWLKLEEMREPLCKALSASDKDIPGPVDEPVEWIRSAAKKWFYETFDDEILELMEEHKIIAQAEGFSASIMAELELDMERAYLLRHPHRKVVMPERQPSDFLAYDSGWNACLDELARLNGEFK